ERGLQYVNVWQRNRKRNLSRNGIEDRDHGDFLRQSVETEAQRLDIRCPIHVDAQGRLRNRNSNVRTEISDVAQRRRTWLDVERVAATRGESFDIGKVGAGL